MSATRANLINIVLDAAIFAAVSISSYFAQLYDRPRTAVLIYLVGVIVIGARSGLAHGLIAGIAASAIFNFFISEPVFRFGASSADELVPLVAFTGSAVLTGAMAGKLKDSARQARAAQDEIALLLRLSDRLQEAISVDQAVQIARESLPFNRLLDLEVFTIKNGQFVNSLTGGATSTARRDLLLDLRANVAGRRFKSYPLMGSESEIGIVNFELAAIEDADEAVDLQGITNILALVVDRCILLEQLATSQAIQKSEVLKTAILSSVSHDLRTPLTAIEAAASSLKSFESTLSDRQKADLLVTITEQCRKLNRYTANLLDMGRIQSGIPSNLFMQVDVVEILGVVLASLRQAYPQQRFEKHIELDPAVINANPAMLEQLIFNLAENAVIHGASEQPVVIRLTGEGEICILEIMDGGKGIPREEQSLVFSKFYRSGAAAQHEGNGLGLHIARGFTEAFGGEISIRSPHEDGPGTKMIVRLPVVAEPAATIGTWE